MITVREDARRRESRWWVICPEHGNVQWTWTQRAANLIAARHEQDHRTLAAIEAELAAIEEEGLA